MLSSNLKPALAASALLPILLLSAELAHAQSSFEYRKFAPRLIVAPQAASAPEPASGPETGPAPALRYSMSASTQTLSITAFAGYSATQSLVLTNTGTGELQLTTPQVAGAAFSATTSCGQTLAAGQSCTITVTFSAATSDVTYGTLTLSSTSGPAAISVSLEGRGLANQAIALWGSYRTWGDGSLGSSCEEYRRPGPGKAYAGATGDGTYRVQPAGQAAADVYCDMTRDEGGWTLVARVRASSMAHKNKAAVSTLTSPTQTAVAKLSDSYINALTQQMYLLRMQTYGTKVFFKAELPFIANSAQNANLPAKLNLADAWTPALTEGHLAHAGLNTWSTTLGRYQLLKAGSALGEGVIFSHVTCTTCYGYTGGDSSQGFGWAGPGDSGTMWVR